MLLKQKLIFTMDADIGVHIRPQFPEVNGKSWLFIDFIILF